jgi:hypothetical protein
MSEPIAANAAEPLLGPIDLTPGDDVQDPRDILNRAEALAPRPEDECVAPEVWARYWIATGLAADTAFRWVLRQPSSPLRGERMAYLSLLAVAAMSAAVPLVDIENHRDLLWSLTPECGALNGEWSEWLTDALDGLGINPADIDPDLRATDFHSASRMRESSGTR